MSNKRWKRSLTFLLALVLALSGVLVSSPDVADAARLDRNAALSGTALQRLEQQAEGHYEDADTVHVIIELSEN